MDEWNASSCDVKHMEQIYCKARKSWLYSTYLGLSSVYKLLTVCFSFVVVLIFPTSKTSKILSSSSSRGSVVRWIPCYGLYAELTEELTFIYAYKHVAFWISLKWQHLSKILFKWKSGREQQYLVQSKHIPNQHLKLIAVLCEFM